MRVTIHDENGTRSYDIDRDGIMPEFIRQLLDAKGKPVHNAETGACMCTSFSQTFPGYPVAFCKECKHPVHNTRAHCGALR
jgi:hypothetical protein